MEIPAHLTENYDAKDKEDAALRGREERKQAVLRDLHPYFEAIKGDSDLWKQRNGQAINGKAISEKSYVSQLAKAYVDIGAVLRKHDLGNAVAEIGPSGVSNNDATGREIQLAWNETVNLLKLGLESNEKEIKNLLQFFCNKKRTRNDLLACHVFRWQEESLRAKLWESIKALIEGTPTPREKAIMETAPQVRPHGPPNTRPSKKKGVPHDEAEILVREWLAANAKENPAAVRRDTIAEETGLSTGAVSGTSAWKAFNQRRKTNSKPTAREIQLSPGVLATMPSGTEKDGMLSDIIEDQRADQKKDERRQTRRHGSS
jgi:hypothetical protein